MSWAPRLYRWPSAGFADLIRAAVRRPLAPIDKANGLLLLNK